MDGIGAGGGECAAMEETCREGVDRIDTNGDGLDGNVDGSTAIVEIVHAIHLCRRTVAEHIGASVA